MEVPGDRFYTKTHEWVKISENRAIIGITSYAIEQLGDITFLEVKPKGTLIKKGEVLGVVESSKTTEKIYAPVSGEIVEINRDCGVVEEGSSEVPIGLEKIVEDPYEEGWIVVLEVKGDLSSELRDLMSSEDYLKHLKEGH
ncbi:glycine cleavage system protein H [Candidatus Korarchaeum cryptofilum]|jgi:glycine cleavage system H protein|uniref:Probable glycine cleavage system H protein n=2 Tax=Candidatus Korarchaeum cryptofilum TaxID=498846 RepID=GCSH_KORCO|nr:glycine cleavage system H protein [Candidatus Korarchaeum cryptofilum]B1L6U5.1 RecName: Full=Probable glycine cleavage system H protein [Candidatus Korarchaeum cryptofilum OPF8]ACB08174.1 glycine cleavage system H protein [Candidatus Korarchaeum cryptofilum OPF8]RSN68846.1 glycine cleavage system protein H [Candidatus Korarchaeum cryptofilum]